MASTTGIEIASNSCTLVDVRPAPEQTTAVRQIRVIGPDEWPAAEAAQADLLRSIRRSGGFPRHAVAVSWDCPDRGPAGFMAPAQRLLEAAGFHVQSILSPPQALAQIAARRQRFGSPAATVWTALSPDGAAIAIVRGRELVYDRTISWKYIANLTDSRAVLLQRYSLIAHLAPEIRHGIDIVRASLGVAVDTIVTCGSLPDLRSLTMPLIEELDVEVETLDSTEGLRAAGQVNTDRLIDTAPAIRLACAAALLPAERSASPAFDGSLSEDAPPAPLRIAAAVALIAAVGWGGFAWRGIVGASPVRAVTLPQSSAVASAPRPAMPSRSPEFRSAASEASSDADATSGNRRTKPGGSNARDDSTPVSTVLSGQAQPGVGRARSVEDKAPTIQAQAPIPPRGGDAAAAAAETGATSLAPRAADRPIARAQPTALKDPLPNVDSILIDQERRLAVIDGSVVGVGDPVGPRTVVQIDRDAVTLREPSGVLVRASVRSRHQS
jgi:hypothetical protein